MILTYSFCVWTIAGIVNAQGGWTACMFATEFGYFNIVQFLIENQAALDIQNEVGMFVVVLKVKMLIHASCLGLRCV